VAQRHPKLLADLVAESHTIGSHGYYHRHGEYEGDYSDVLARKYFAPHRVHGYRSPYWDTTQKPGWSGGGFLRLLPYTILRQNILRSGVLWLHPHDIDVQTPIRSLRRRLGLQSAYRKFYRLLTELHFDEGYLRK